MSVSYYVIEREIMAGPEKGTYKRFGQTRMKSLVSFDKICERVTTSSTGTGGDAKGVLKSLLDIVSEIISEGKIAQVGALGNFRPTAGGPGAETEEALSAHQIRTPGITFYPGKKLREMLKSVGYELGNFILVEEKCTERVGG